MKLFGFEITKAQNLSTPESRAGSGWSSWLVREPYAGAWQRNEELTADQALAFWAPFACHTLICADVAKNRVKLVSLQGEVWRETTNPAYSPVLRKPNGYQTRIQFLESWVNSKLARGNTYVLKQRDGRGVVTGLFVLNPDRVQPLVADDGSVFYRLSKDNLSGLEQEDIIVPAREVIHDRFNCLFHPLVGISPLYAAALAATQGTSIQRSNARLAANGVRPGGILTAPGRIDPDNAARIKEVWETQYAGEAGASRVAVLGDGLKFEALTMTGEEAQLIEQLKFTAEMICAVYHVPPYKIGVGPLPSYNNVQALNVEYYSQCLQKHIEDIELCLDEGLGIGEGVSVNGTIYGVEIDVKNLLRMDSVTQMQVLKEGVSAGLVAPDEGRGELGYSPVPGGKYPYLQQQNYSLEALSKRDATEDPFGTAKPEPVAPPEPANDDEEAERTAAKAMSALLAHSIREKLNARR